MLWLCFKKKKHKTRLRHDWVYWAGDEPRRHCVARRALTGLMSNHVKLVECWTGVIKWGGKQARGSTLFVCRPAPGILIECPLLFSRLRMAHSKQPPTHQLRLMMMTDMIGHFFACYLSTPPPPLAFSPVKPLWQLYCGGFKMKSTTKIEQEDDDDEWNWNAIIVIVFGRAAKNLLPQKTISLTAFCVETFVYLCMCVCVCVQTLFCLFAALYHSPQEELNRYCCNGASKCITHSSANHLPDEHSSFPLFLYSVLHLLHFLQQVLQCVCAFRPANGRVVLTFSTSDSLNCTFLPSELMYSGDRNGSSDAP